MVFAHSGDRIASASEDGTVRVWKIAGLEPLVVLTRKEAPDAWRLSHFPIRVEERFYFSSVCFTPDDRVVIASSGSIHLDNALRAWDAATGEAIFCLRGHDNVVNSLAVSADGQWLVSGALDGTARVWDLQTGAQTHCLSTPSTSSIESVAISRDNLRVISGSMDGIVREWDLRSGAEVRRHPGHDGMVWCVALSGGGQFVASGGDDHAVRVWDLRPGEEEVRRFHGHASTITSLAFTPDGTQVASASEDGTLIVWDSATGRPLHRLRGHEMRVNHLCYSPDNRFLASASADRTVRLWDMNTGAALCCLEGHEKEVIHLDVSPDGEVLASVSCDGTARLWRWRSDPSLIMAIQLDEGFDAMYKRRLFVRFAADGRRLLLSLERILLIGDWTTGKVFLGICFEADAIEHATLSPDGCHAALALADRTVRVLHVDGASEIHHLKGHGGPVVEVLFSSDGRRLASFSSREETLTGAIQNLLGAEERPIENEARVWDTESGECLEIIHGRVSLIEVVEMPPVRNFRLVQRALEAVVQTTDRGVAAAWLPIEAKSIVAYPSRPIWAVSARHENDVRLITIEGSEDH